MFRPELDLHPDCFTAVCVLTQIAIRNGEPLFQVDYSDNLDVSEEESSGEEEESDGDDDEESGTAWRTAISLRKTLRPKADEEESTINEEVSEEEEETSEEE